MTNPASRRLVAAYVLGLAGCLSEQAQIRAPLPPTPLTDRTSESLEAPYRTVSVLLNRLTRYNLEWAEQAHPRRGDAYALVAMKTRAHREFERNVRPEAHVALATAALLYTGAYDESLAGLPRAEAEARALALIRGVADTHRQNLRSSGVDANWVRVKGWSRNWQSALVAGDAAFAAWLLWDQLDPSARERVLRMVEFEADRFIAEKYEIAYWNGKGTDSKGEENAWDSVLPVIAVAMLPDHPHVAAWRAAATRLMIAATTRKDDLSSGQHVDGKPVHAWVSGFNLRPTGVLVNRKRLHPVYMAVLAIKLRGVLTQSLIGEPIPEAALFNLERVYHALTELEFTAPPYQPPGGTIYIKGSPDLYYPEGTEKGQLYEMFWSFDAYARVFGWDRKAPCDWLALRGEKLLALQQRHPNGTIYARDEFKLHDHQPQYGARSLTEGLLVLWLARQGRIGPVRGWPVDDPIADAH